MYAYSIPYEIDLGQIIKDMYRDSERIHIVRAVLNSITEEGTIAILREIVNDPKWNDQ
jgi:hypothetical protein